jgi:hypothetical protein
MDFDFYSASYNTYRPLSPSSHEMRCNPFLGSMNLETQKGRKWRGTYVKSGKMSGNGMMTFQGDPPVIIRFPEGNPLTRKPCQPPR